MQPKLIVVGGKASKREVLLKLPCTIGRSREADLTVAHPMVSRKHCEVFDRGGLVMVRDLGSLNGTYTGGRRVREAPLPPNKEFTVGPLTFRVLYDYAGDLGALPPVIPAEESPPAQAAQAPSAQATPVQPARPADGETLIEPPRVADLAETIFEPIDDPTPGRSTPEPPRPGDSGLEGFLEDLK
ncbi:MAG: FHA domain-containing protein [Planctomycetia bacterium]|nr:FHA domain-containing protein [Planctomycetia bacterium]